MSAATSSRHASVFNLPCLQNHTFARESVAERFLNCHRRKLRMLTILFCNEWMTIPNLYNRFPSTELVECISSTLDVADARLGSTVPEEAGGGGGP